jgi:hypothetical protein
MAAVNLLIDGIRRFTDKTFSGFVKFPENEPEAALFWSDAVRSYLTTVLTPPPLVPVRAVLAAEAFKGAVIGFSLPLQAPLVLPRAFAVAAAVFAGMSVPVAVPPPAPLVIPPMPPVNNALIGATVIATSVDLWFKTGLWGIPPAPPVPPWV